MSASWAGAILTPASESRPGMPAIMPDAAAWPLPSVPCHWRDHSSQVAGSNGPGVNLGGWDLPSCVEAAAPLPVAMISFVSLPSLFEPAPGIALAGTMHGEMLSDWIRFQPFPSGRVSRHICPGTGLEPRLAQAAARACIHSDSGSLLSGGRGALVASAMRYACRKNLGIVSDSETFEAIVALQRARCQCGNPPRRRALPDLPDGNAAHAPAEAIEHSREG
ncbi:protein of unknown function [Cupriavidus taiwanensis]|uniref:Uncharacterized protein n=1 Tax=Cupriavidus taiwanensis TaxID=164546 RepID=A0A9Q7UTH3_9BURK|nr:protein of unknown function [Cupriavidus taiwanensis]